MSRWQYNHCFYAKPHSVQLERPVTRSASETEVKLPTTVIICILFADIVTLYHEHTAMTCHMSETVMM